jgi:hypothetical protein
MKRSLRNGIGAVAAGALLVIVAVAGFIVVPEHKPHKVATYRQVPENSNGPTRGAVVCNPGPQYYQPASVPTPEPGNCEVRMTHLAPSHTLYDVLRVLPWALAIIGVLLVALGLIRYARVGDQRVP